MARLPQRPDPDIVSLGLHEGTEDCLHDPTAFPLPALTSSLVLLF